MSVVRLAARLVVPCASDGKVLAPTREVLPSGGQECTMRVMLISAIVMYVLRVPTTMIPLLAVVALFAHVASSADI